jgi:hypothetical protein
MTGQARGKGRPAKSESLAFQLLALAAHARRLSQEGIRDRMNTALAPDSISQPTVGKWIREALPSLATPTAAIHRPDDLGLRVTYLLFKRKPALALKLIGLLRREPLVSRVEQLRGEMNVFAEVITSDSRGVDDLVERYEPDSLCEVVDRSDRLPDVLEHLARTTPAE